MTGASGSIRRFLVVTVGAAALLVTPTAIAAAGTSEDGWAHRSAEAQTVDGWSQRSPEAETVDGWATRSPQAPVTDGFEVTRMVLPRGTEVLDGFQVSQIQLPQSSGIAHGFEVALVELPQAQPVQDGWAVRSELTRRAAPAIDGWSYAALATGPEQVASAPVPAPSRQPVTPPYELILMAALAVALVAGGAMLGYHRHHHIPA